MSPADLAVRGIDGSEITWIWTSSDYGAITATSYETCNVTSFAATERAYALFQTLDFAIADVSYIKLTRYERPGAATTYNATLHLYLERGDLILAISAPLGSADGVPDLIVASGGGIVAGYLSSRQPRVPAGRGQRKNVVARAREIYALGSDVRGYAGAVRIHYATRAGKYGRMDKTAVSIFPLGELAVPGTTRIDDDLYARKVDGSNEYETGRIDLSDPHPSFIPLARMPPWWTLRQHSATRCIHCGTLSPQMEGSGSFIQPIDRPYTCCGTKDRPQHLTVDLRTGEERAL